MTSPALVDVVPLTNLPRGKDRFTYACTDAMDASGGELVRIPFGRRTIDGVVWNVARGDRELNFKPRRIVKFEGTVMSNGQRAMIERCSTTLGGSRSSMCTSFVRFQKRFSADFMEWRSDKSSSTQLMCGPTAEVCSLMSQRLAISDNRNQNLLLIPTKEIGELLKQRLENKLSSPTILFVHSGKRVSELSSIAQRLQSPDSSAVIVIATHMGLFLPWRRLQNIWLVDDHHPAHRQWDSEPRIDNRILAQWLAEYWGAHLFTSSVAPTLSTVHSFHEKLMLWERDCFDDPRIQRWPAGSVANGNSKPWIAWIREHLETGRSVIVIASGTGRTNRVSECRTCGQLLRCSACGRALSIQTQPSQQWYCAWCRTVPSIATCPQCYGAQFRTLAPSIERFARTLGSIFHDYAVEILQQHDQLFTAGDRHPAVLVATSPMITAAIDTLRWNGDAAKCPPLLVWSLENLHPIGYLQEERQWQTLMSIVDAVNAGTIHSAGIAGIPTRLHSLLNSDGWWNQWYADQWNLRKQFSYPPAEHIVLLDTHQRFPQNTNNLEKSIATIANVQIIQHGQSLARRKGYRQRSFLLLRVNTSDTTILGQRCKDILAQIPAQWSFTLDPELLPFPLPH